jgi:hypothetical protein
VVEFGSLWTYRDGGLRATSCADVHGAVVFKLEELDKLPAAIDLMARREKVILDAARKPGFGLPPCATRWPPPSRSNKRPSERSARLLLL